MIIQKLDKAGLIHPPKWLPTNCHYLTITGSMAYAVSSDNSDMDVIGFCIPPKDDMFPHLRGEIPGFGNEPERFEQFNQVGVKDPNGSQEWDLTIYSIVKYVYLCMSCNPNMIDSMFTPQRCIIHCTPIGQLIRDNRQMFLSKLAFKKFRGYAYSQRSKIEGRVNSTNPKRAELIKKHGFDTKFAYHIVRLMQECEMILVDHTLDLEEGREILKSIRRGEWSLEKIDSWFEQKAADLESIYSKSTLRDQPDQDAIKNLLLQAIEMHYGSISQAVKLDKTQNLINELQSVLSRYKED